MPLIVTEAAFRMVMRPSANASPGAREDCAVSGEDLAKLQAAAVGRDRREHLADRGGDHEDPVQQRGAPEFLREFPVRIGVTDRDPVEYD